jgi:hypothetical protein
MGMRPAERHPSRIISKENNFLFHHFLDATALPVEGVPDNKWDNDWDGVTHMHGPIEGENWVLYVLTHYVPETDTYHLLYMSRSDYIDIDTDNDGLTVIIDRGKTQEELSEAKYQKLMDEDLERIAPVIQLIKSID